MVELSAGAFAMLYDIAKRAKAQLEAREEWEACDCDKASAHPCDHQVRYRHACDLTETDAERLATAERAAKHSRDGAGEA